MNIRGRVFISTFWISVIVGSPAVEVNGQSPTDQRVEPVQNTPVFRAEVVSRTAKAVDYADFEGRCCPSWMSVVPFRWDGKQFQRIQAKRVPLPKEH